MVNYSCGQCGKTFKQKGHYTKHLQRKTPCDNIKDKIEKIVENKVDELVEEKIQELVQNGEIKNINLNLNSNTKQTSTNMIDGNSTSEEINDEIKKVEGILKNKNLISTNQNNSKNITMDIQNKEGIDYLSTVENNSVDLVLTDPPYITSTETGMGNLHKQIEENKEKGIKYVKTEEDWESVKDKYVEKKGMSEEKMKLNFMKYGSIFGSKYSVQTEYGEWDTSFTMDILDNFIGEYYKKLKKGGTMIIFFDLWKITPLKDLMEKHKFKQIRFIEWIKTNPQPLNSKTNYLTNCREMALLGVKGGKPTFNSSYDNAIYQYPIQGGKNRFHPTQKSLPLFEELIRKHTEEGDIVLDTFLGSGTTAIASKNTKRIFMGCEVSKEYYDKLMKLV